MSRAKYKLSQSRERARGKGGKYSSGGPPQPRRAGSPCAEPQVRDYDLREEDTGRLEQGEDFGKLLADAREYFGGRLHRHEAMLDALLAPQAPLNSHVDSTQVRPAPSVLLPASAASDHSPQVNYSVYPSNVLTHRVDGDRSNWILACWVNTCRDYPCIRYQASTQPPRMKRLSLYASGQKVSKMEHAATSLHEVQSTLLLQQQFQPPQHAVQLLLQPSLQPPWHTLPHQSHPSQSHLKLPHSAWATQEELFSRVKPVHLAL
jgi:hypothetical protein